MSAERVGRWTGLGVRQEVTPTRQAYAADRFEEKLAAHMRAGAHLWVVTLAHLVDPPLREGTLLDADTLAFQPAVGCFICEQPFEPALKHRRCPGDPEGRL